MMVKIIFSKTIRMENQVLNYLDGLLIDNPELLAVVEQAFIDLKSASVNEFPIGVYKPFIVDKKMHGTNTQFELIKKLSEPRIFELRVDHNKECHRFIYFPYIYQSEQCYIFVYGFVKMKGKPDFTNHYMVQAKMLYDYLKRNGNENRFFEG